MVPILLSNTVLTEDELRAIGNVAVELTYCEHMVEDIIWTLAGMKNDQGKFFTDRMQLDKRLELMGDLWKPQLAGDDLKKLTDLISDIKEANNDRNTIIHGFWHMPKLPLKEWMANQKFPPATAEKRRLRSDPIKFSATNIRKTAERISDLTGALWEFAYDKGLLQ
jgi:hypothetical protein